MKFFIFFQGLPYSIVVKKGPSSPVIGVLSHSASLENNMEIIPKNKSRTMYDSAMPNFLASIPKTLNY